MDVTRLSIGAALVVGAVITAVTVWYAWPSGPSSSDMIAIHKREHVKGWVDESAIDQLHARWSTRLGGRMLPVTASATLKGGAVVHEEPLWLHLGWRIKEARVSVFVTPVDHDRQPQWSCKSARGAVEVCQRTHQGWHVVMVRDAPVAAR